MKKLCLFFLTVCILFSSVLIKAEEIETSSKSHILMDAMSGKILSEKNADEKMPPASITKIMTMLLTVEAIDNGAIDETDIVTVSKNAAIKTGSHVFLSEGEKISVNELLKCVAVASGNDASIALAEYIAGTHDEFVKQMNSRAKELGMTNTNFVNCNGLDAENHYSTARDIAYMTNELLKHDRIFKYTTIWMDTIRNGEFGLSNTNKLIRFYEGANGMKTGSTSVAGCCLSATAKRGDLQLTAVILNAPTSKDRFADASDLLNYGFNNFENVKFCDKNQVFKYAKINNGVTKIVKLVHQNTVCTTLPKSEKNNVKKTIELPEIINAPVKKGDVVGKIKYSVNNEDISTVNIVADEDVKETDFLYLFLHIIKGYLSVI